MTLPHDPIAIRRLRRHTTTTHCMGKTEGYNKYERERKMPTKGQVSVDLAEEKFHRRVGVLRDIAESPCLNILREVSQGGMDLILEGSVAC